MHRIEENLILELKKHLGSGRKEYCVVCQNSIPPGALHCRVCGPPKISEAEPEKESLTKTQTFLRIAVMVLLFSAIAVYKQEIKIKLPWIDQSPVSEEEALEGQGVNPDNAYKPDFKIVHIVNVPGANIRSEPSIVARKVTVLPLGTRVKVLETRQGWTRIRSKGAEGWVASRLLDKQTVAVE